MSIFTSLNVSGSALTAQRLRMDVVAANMANIDTTRGKYVNGVWEPYKRKMVVLEPGNSTGFSSMLKNQMNKEVTGVKVTKVVEDSAPAKLVYNPSHPDADDTGYVQMPNVDPLKEMVDLVGASRSYEANVTVLNASKGMLMKALEIGK